MSKEQSESNKSKRTLEFVRLLTDHQGILRSFISSLMPNHPDARDLLQEINIILWERMDSFELGTNFKAWAFVVARNKVLNERRKLKRNGWLVFDDDVLDRVMDSTADTSAEQQSREQEALEGCLKKLRPKDLELIQARYSSRLELAQFAEQVGRSRQSLRVSLFRLRVGLRRCIEDRLNIERVKE